MPYLLIVVSCPVYAESAYKNRPKDVPVNKGIQFYKRILELGEPFEQKIFIKKAARIDVFPDSRE